MKKSIIITFAGIVMAMGCFAQAQVLKTYTLVKGDSVTCVLKFQVDNGYYIFSPETSGTEYMSAEIVWKNIPGNLKPVGKPVGKPEWPIAGLHGSSSVYNEGEYEVKQVFLRTGKKPKGGDVLKGIFTFQGCQEEMCFPPVQKEFVTTVNKSGL